MTRRKLSNQGLLFSGIQYWDDILPAIAKPGQDVLIRYDPSDISRLFALDKTGAYHAIAYADLAHPAITLSEAKAAIKSLDRRERGRGFGYRIMQAVKQQREILATAKSATKSQRRTKQRSVVAKRHSGRTDRQSDPLEHIDFDTEPPIYPVENWDE